MTAETEKVISEIIEQAAVVVDPLKNLIAKAKTDPGAAFEPDVLACLADLKKHDPLHFDKLRGELKKVGVLVGKLDKAIPSSYEMSPDGLFYEGSLLSAPFEVLGRGRDPNGAGWSTCLKWKDPDGREHTHAVSDARLHGEVGALCGDLAQLGLRIATASRNRARFVAYLNLQNTDKRVTLVNRTGWCSLPSGKVYVLPERTIGDTDGESVVFVGAQNPPHAFAGTLEEWRNTVGKLATGQNRVVFCISVACAAMLAELVDAESGGVHLYGQSSTGKTTAADAAASLLGRGDERGGFVRTWRHTANGLEGAAVLHNDGPLVLDEIGIADSREIGQVVYTLCGGTGKGRAGRDGSLRASNTWRSQIISTGEMRVIDKIVEGGKRPRAGQEVRIVDIPADAGQGFGIFDHAGDCNDPEKLADSIKAAARTFYGMAGPAFVEGLLKKGTDAVAKQVRAAIEAFRSANVDDAADGQVKRVANRFALAAAAGEIAIELGIVPWGAGAATTAAVAMYKAWLESRGGLEPVEIRNMIQQVRSLIERYGDSRFDPIEGAERPAHERYGWCRGKGDARAWLIPPETWRTVFAAGYDPTTVGRTLAERGMLIRDGQQLSRSEWVDGRTHRVYVLTAKILAGESPSKPTSEGSGAPAPKAPLTLEDLSKLL